MKILVTGAAGLPLYTKDIDLLPTIDIVKKINNEDKIVALDLLTYAGNLKNLDGCKDNPNFSFVKMDICDREAINSLFEKEGFDIVVNFAAESHVDRSIENPEIFLKTNILGTQVLMDASLKYGVIIP